MGALEGLASLANGPIGAAADGSSTAPSTSTAGSDAAMAALSARIRDLEAGLARGRTDLSGTQVSLAVAETRLQRSEARARLLEERVTDTEEGLRAVVELVGQWASRQMNRDEVRPIDIPCTFTFWTYLTLTLTSQVAEAVEEMLPEDDDSVQ